ncbi:MAG: penicillin acylase family protein [Bacteroidales bacterium]|nr:penicillin acylase family protein [Bacteroidales bacterium]
MKTFKKILVSLAILIAILAVAAVLFVNSAKNAAKPLYEGDLSIRGIDEQVRVFFDERGMPHIFAGTEKDLYFATGYLMARERMWQMDLIRRATRGTLSEIFGKDFVETDLFLRSLCMTEKSKVLLADSSPEILLAIQYYCDGVNRYISDAGRKLPPEFTILRYRPDPWTPEDVTNIIGYMGWDLASSSLSEDIFNYRLMDQLGPEAAERIIPDWKASDSFVFPDFIPDSEMLDNAQEFISSTDKLEALGIFAFTGSNNWALSGDRTTTGKPVLSNDMHLGLSSPGIWIQMHQVVEGKLNVTGVAVPGQPFIVAGHNENIAWGMTNLMVDDIDLFRETVDSTNPEMYLFNGNQMKMEKREEIIRIKGGDEETRTLLFTHRGPVVSGMRGINNAVLSMRWSGYDLSDEIYTVYSLNRAASWDEFRDAISKFRSISQNFVYADREGNIGLNTGGGVPVRKGKGTIIRDGSTDEYDWIGYVPFDQLPSSLNPPAGYVSSANNKTVSDDYPYYIATSFAMPFRINQIRSMIGSREKHSIEDFKSMVTDQHSDYATMLVPELLRAIPDSSINGEYEKKAVELLQSWDYNMTADGEAPAVFEFVRTALGRELIGDELGDLYSSLPSVYRDYYIYKVLLTGPDEWVDNTGTADIESLDQILYAAFRKGVDDLVRYTAENGKSNWLWGDIHQMVLEHPMASVPILDRIFRLNSPPYRTGGSYHTVSPYSYGQGFKVNNGASQRHIYNTADWDASWSIIPTGNSGVPGTIFYLSQTESYVAGRIYPDYFTERAVVENAKYSLILVPEL